MVERSNYRFEFELHEMEADSAELNNLTALPEYAGRVKELHAWLTSQSDKGMESARGGVAGQLRCVTWR